MSPCSHITHNPMTTKCCILLPQWQVFQDQIFKTAEASLYGDFLTGLSSWILTSFNLSQQVLLWEKQERWFFLGKPKDRLLLVLNPQHHDAYSDFKKTLQTVCCLLSIPWSLFGVKSLFCHQHCREYLYRRSHSRVTQRGHSWSCRGAGTALLQPCPALRAH